VSQNGQVTDALVAYWFDGIYIWVTIQQQHSIQNRNGLQRVYAVVARNQHTIHFVYTASPAANPDKYEDELLDAYFYVENVVWLLRFGPATRCTSISTLSDAGQSVCIDAYVAESVAGRVNYATGDEKVSQR
jgi:hypothetical protein